MISKEYGWEAQTNGKIDRNKFISNNDKRIMENIWEKTHFQVQRRITFEKCSSENVI